MKLASFVRSPVERNSDLFSYNARGEVVAAMIGGQSETHAYNDIGTHVTSTDPGASTTYGSNARNQYASIVRTADASQEVESVSVAYDEDGSLTTFGPWTYAYDSGRRLTSVASNGVTVATMSYDAQGRRVKKVAVDGTHRYFYDGWLLVYEHVTHADSTVDEIDYVWGKDISGRRNGAAGSGGTVDFYSPSGVLDVTLGHFPHDVWTYEYAKFLDRIDDYYSVRPSW